MTENPLVAIIVLNYNGGRYLPLALRSLDSLTYEPKRIIIIDNDSEDDSFENAQKAFPGSIFLRNSANFGFAGGMNVGIREAFRLGAKYVWLFNNDARADADSLSKLVSFCEGNADVGAASPIIVDSHGGAWFSEGEISYWRMRASHVAHGGGREVSLPYQSEYLSGCALFLPVSVLRSVGLLDERYFLYYEDTDLSLRIRKSGKKLFVVPEARVSHEEQSEGGNAEKRYHLVLSGLLFFHEHAPAWLCPFLWGYERFRRMKNRMDIFFGREEAYPIYRAYKEYDRQQALH